MSLREPEDPPDGGYGWICCVSQFILNGFTWGIVASYSVYLSFYLREGLFPSGQPRDFALIGGLNFSIALLVAPVATLFSRLLGFKTAMSIGLILLPTGFLAASFATEIWHLYLSQGACVGAGVGFLYMPSMPIVSQWFSKKRSLANGICAAGSGIFGLILCLTTQVMLDHIGLAWSLRTTAAIALVMNSISIYLMRSRNATIDPTQRMFDHHLLQRYEVMLVLAWSFVMMLGYITLMFSLSDYTIAIGRSARNAALVVALLNLGAAIGRPFIGVAADRWGRINVAGSLTFGCGVLCFVLWLPTTSYAVLIVFAIIGGAILGVFWSMIGPLSTDIVGLKELPSMLSLVWLVVVLPATFAEVIALQLRRNGARRPYLYTQIFGGTSYLVSSLFLLELWRVRTKKVTLPRIRDAAPSALSDFKSPNQKPGLRLDVAGTGPQT